MVYGHDISNIIRITYDEGSPYIGRRRSPYPGFALRRYIDLHGSANHFVRHPGKR